MRAGRKPPIAPDAFGERMRARVGSGELTFTANADMGFVIGQYEEGFVAAINRVAAGDMPALFFVNLEWGDAEADQFLLVERQGLLWRRKFIVPNIRACRLCQTQQRKLELHVRLRRS